jgi:hypothetical protein
MTNIDRTYAVDGKKNQTIAKNIFKKAPKRLDFSETPS